MIPEDRLGEIIEDLAAVGPVTEVKVTIGLDGTLGALHVELRPGYNEPSPIEDVLEEHGLSLYDWTPYKDGYGGRATVTGLEVTPRVN